MKLRKFVLKGGMSELLDSELKKLKGGTNVPMTTCFCQCINGIGSWYTNVPYGKCGYLQAQVLEFCASEGICHDVNEIFLGVWRLEFSIDSIMS